MKKLVAIILGIAIISPTPAIANIICDEACQYEKIMKKYPQLAEPIHKSNQDSLSKINLSYNNELKNINNEFMAKESLAQASYNNALIKWKEIDQITGDNTLWSTDCKAIIEKVNNEIKAGTRMGSFVQNGMNVCIWEAPFYNKGKIINYEISYREHAPGFAISYWGKTVDPIKAGYPNAWIAGGPSKNVAHELIPSFPYNHAERWTEWITAYPEYTKNFNWDLEQEYHPQSNNKTLVEASRILVSFQNGWVWSVRNDGSRVSPAEFSMTRNNVKSAYAEILAIRKQNADSVNSLNNKFASLIASVNQKYEQELKALSNTHESELAEIKWVTESNKELISNFPATAKKQLMKQGYFKPLKTFYWTCETGRYIASAEWLDQYTFAVSGYWEKTTCKDVPTKKEQKIWIKKSNDKLAEYQNKYNSIISWAKQRGLVVQCVANTPCKISFVKD